MTNRELTAQDVGVIKTALELAEGRLSMSYGPSHIMWIRISQMQKLMARMESWDDDVIRAVVA